MKPYLCMNQSCMRFLYRLNELSKHAPDLKLRGIWQAMSEKKRLEFTLAQVRRELEEEMIERKRIQVELDQMVRLKTFYLV